MSFKKFIEYIVEKKKSDSKDIEQASPETPPVDPSAPLTCPKCGTTAQVCDCYIDDYYNAKTPYMTPRASKQKPKKKKDE